MLRARLLLSLLWISQVARILADWGLRITAFLELRDLGGREKESAWHLATAVYILPFIVLAPLHGSLSNGLPKRGALVASSLFCLLVLLIFTPTQGPWIWCLGMMALGSALYSATRYAILPAAALAAPPTDQDQFHGRVEKHTDDSSFVKKPKSLCVCIDDDNPDDERMAGVLVDTVAVGSDGLRRIQVRCFVRRFNANGSAPNSEACSSTWALLD